MGVEDQSIRTQRVLVSDRTERDDQLAECRHMAESSDRCGPDPGRLERRQHQSALPKSKYEGQPNERIDLFWVNTTWQNDDLPAATIRNLGGIDHSKRVGCTWRVTFTDHNTGRPVPDTFTGVTGFNDLDGWESQPDLAFEGVQLGDGFTGATV